MRLYLLALSIIFLFSCNRNTVRLEHTNAKGEVPQLGNLTFRFSNAMVPDSLVKRMGFYGIYFSSNHPYPEDSDGSSRMNLYFLRHSHWLLQQLSRQN